MPFFSTPRRNSAGSQPRRRRSTYQNAVPLSPSRGPDGHFRPVVQVEGMEDVIIGGWTMPMPRAPRDPSPRPARPDSNGHASVNSNNAPPPEFPASTGYPFVRRPSSTDEIPLSQLRPPERSKALNFRKTVMEPYLHFMCGPLLRYDTVDEHGVWHGAALIVTADANSTYEPYPTLKYRLDVQNSALHHGQRSTQGAEDVDVGLTASPTSLHFRNQANDEHLEGSRVEERSVIGAEIYVYSGRLGTYTFWRFLLNIPLADSEMKVQYSINGGPEMDFFVPGRHQTMRVAAYSCNGFSASVNSDDFRGEGFLSGYDPVWVDLLSKHAEQPFHLLVGGGDQIYSDAVVLEPEMQEWLKLKNPEKKMNYPLTEEIKTAIDRFHFNHYCQSFRSGAFARANSSIPMLNMLDDHDMIDGFGSYPDDWQNGPVFKAIGSRAYFFFLLFQCFINVTVDGVNDRSHVFKSVVLGGPGPYVPFPSHSFLTPIGPTAWLLMLDCRAERKLGQVCSEKEYANVFDRLNNTLPPSVEHVIIQLGIPILYPRLGLLETVLSSRFFPAAALNKLGFKVNEFNGDAELLDDLNDHWTSKQNKAERNQFIKRLQEYARNRRIRISFLTGDVHCAAVGVLKTLTRGRGSSLEPASDHRYMLNVVSSAIVNTPPPSFALTLVDWWSKKPHRTLHHANTDEKMLPVFKSDTDGSKPKSRYIMGRRNWCEITLEETSGDLSFEIHVEKKKGHGETVGYSVRAPAPRWTPTDRVE